MHVSYGAKVFGMQVSSAPQVPAAGVAPEQVRVFSAQVGVGRVWFGFGAQLPGLVAFGTTRYTWPLELRVAFVHWLAAAVQTLGSDEITVKQETVVSPTS
ncbi:MAG: hypothetical protein DYH12_29230 [Sorangiineae bacterium PRO1]|nr:hypothetical protein [Sorangiineae bacterium PRO1]